MRFLPWFFTFCRRCSLFFVLFCAAIVLVIFFVRHLSQLMVFVEKFRGFLQPTCHQHNVVIISLAFSHVLLRSLIVMCRSPVGNYRKNRCLHPLTYSVHTIKLFASCCPKEVNTGLWILTCWINSSHFDIDNLSFSWLLQKRPGDDTARAQKRTVM